MKIRVHAKDSNVTTVGKFSNFNFLRGHCTLLPYLLLLCHYAILVASSAVTINMATLFASMVKLKDSVRGQ